jgi:hypothetical protein
LKECASELAGPLHILLQTSLSEGSLPKAFKEGSHRFSRRDHGQMSIIIGR